jgi:hypothetical protein
VFDDEPARFLVVEHICNDDAHALCADRPAVRGSLVRSRLRNVTEHQNCARARKRHCHTLSNPSARTRDERNAT